MLLIRELSRVIGNVVRFSIATRGIWLLLAIALAAHNAGGGRLSPEPMKNEIFQVSTMTAFPLPTTL